MSALIGAAAATAQDVDADDVAADAALETMTDFDLTILGLSEEAKGAT
jgi:hypothetical protein